MNQKAMKYSSNSDYNTAFYILNRLETIFQKHRNNMQVESSKIKSLRRESNATNLNRLEALTYNNLGFIYIKSSLN